MVTSSTHNNVASDGPTAFTILLVATARRVTLKTDPCGTPHLEDAAQIAYSKFRHRHNKPGENQKQTAVVDL
jgi:hypothetical protein